MTYEGSSAQIKDKNVLLAATPLIQPIGDRRSRRLIDYTQYI
jgi:hypothetical protein